jgi:hypothetical protein
MPCVQHTPVIVLHTQPVLCQLALICCITSNESFFFFILHDKLGYGTTPIDSETLLMTNFVNLDQSRLNILDVLIGVGYACVCS